MTLIDPRASMSLGLKARLDGGQATSLSETVWDVSARCERPQRVTVEGRQYRAHTFDPHWGWVRPAGAGLDGEQKWSAVEGMVRGHATHLEVRCGKCAQCLLARRYMWTERARTECARATRTWFVTLTASPTTQLQWSAAAAERLRAGGTEPTKLDEVEWYRERTKEAGRELQKYIKRVRKKSGSGLRMLWVFERHEGGGPHDGLPHIHGLVHESEQASVNYRILKSEWTLGYSTQKLLTPGPESDHRKVAGYVAKCCGYLSKSTCVRIRASRHYGVPLGQEPFTVSNHRAQPVRQVGTHPVKPNFTSPEGCETGGLGSETAEPSVVAVNAYAAITRDVG